METRSPETYSQLMSRMHHKAELDGVTLESLGAGRFATRSNRTMGGSYVTTSEVCSCLGFERHGYCKHQAAVVAAVKPICPACGDTGIVTYTLSVSATCQLQDQHRCHACQPAPVNRWKGLD